MYSDDAAGDFRQNTSCPYTCVDDGRYEWNAIGREEEN